MRRILVDHAKAKHRETRASADQPLTPDEEQAGEAAQDLDMLELDLALKGLAAFEEGKSRIVELHYLRRPELRRDRPGAGPFPRHGSPRPAPRQGLAIPREERIGVAVSDRTAAFDCESVP